jgi:hypothetical protein
LAGRRLAMNATGTEQENKKEKKQIPHGAAMYHS